jgi:hypothetical protein
LDASGTIAQIEAPAPSGLPINGDFDGRPARPVTVPFDTVRGRKIATPISISTLTPVKNSACTTVADVTPATDADRAKHLSLG